VPLRRESDTQQVSCNWVASHYSQKCKCSHQTTRGAAIGTGKRLSCNSRLCCLLKGRVSFDMPRRRGRKKAGGGGGGGGDGRGGDGEEHSQGSGGRPQPTLAPSDKDLGRGFEDSGSEALPHGMIPSWSSCALHKVPSGTPESPHTRRCICSGATVFFLSHSAGGVPAPLPPSSESSFSNSDTEKPFSERYDEFWDDKSDEEDSKKGALQCGGMLRLPSPVHHSG
jgi:hypothetical protein